MKNLNVTTVTLNITYDPEGEFGAEYGPRQHPADWDWRTLLDLEGDEEVTVTRSSDLALAGRTPVLYLDLDDEARDGRGYNVLFANSAFADRFATLDEAVEFFRVLTEAAEFDLGGE